MSKILYNICDIIINNIRKNNDAHKYHVSVGNAFLELHTSQIQFYVGDKSNIELLTRPKLKTLYCLNFYIHFICVDGKIITRIKDRYRYSEPPCFYFHDPKFPNNCINWTNEMIDFHIKNIDISQFKDFSIQK